jgi:transcriptional regulator with XRE-family HTH domain
MDIADRVQNLRKTKGISQEELADTLGVSRQAVSKWESAQSIPDTDKIIIMSDYFDVTTDYLLKGKGNEKQANEKAVDAHTSVIIATVLNFIGLISACALWYEHQNAMAFVVGLGLMAIGCMVCGVGYNHATRNKEKAMRKFWQINIWILAFIPLSFAYNMLFTGFNAPYPVLGGTRLFPLLGGLVYFSLCFGVVLAAKKGEK